VNDWSWPNKAGRSPVALAGFFSSWLADLGSALNQRVVFCVGEITMHAHATGEALFL